MLEFFRPLFDCVKIKEEGAFIFLQKIFKR